MVGQLNLNQLKEFAPQSPILVFRHTDTGSPMQDWCRHLSQNPLRRQELEEFAVLGEVVVRIADELEPDPLERVRIMSLEYAIRTLGDEIDGREFIRCVRAIASPDAGQYEYEQIAAYYYAEIRRRGVQDVLKEMGLLGLQMEAVTSTIADREIDAVENAAGEQKLTVADQRRSKEAAKKRMPLLPRTPIFDEELAAVLSRVGRQKMTRMLFDDYAEFFLDDHGKSIEDLDQDFLTYEGLEQYDENGIIGFSMSSGQRSVVVFDFDAEVEASYLPADVRPLASQIGWMFVGHSMGGDYAQTARCLIASAKAEKDEIAAGRYEAPANVVKHVDSYSRQPITESQFSDWLAAKLDRIYDRRVVRSIRRIRYSRNGGLFEYLGAQETNPDHDEMQYVAAICQLLWNRQKLDFHLRSLRKETYQDFYLAIRNTLDTAEAAALKKEAYSAFKEQKQLTVKEFTALNTVAKSQEARLANRLSPTTRQWMQKIAIASPSRLRFLKFALYNDHDVQALTRQEKQRLWDSVRTREAEFQAETRSLDQSLQQELFRTNSLQHSRVKVTPLAASAI